MLFVYLVRCNKFACGKIEMICLLLDSVHCLNGRGFWIKIPRGAQKIRHTSIQWENYSMLTCELNWNRLRWKIVRLQFWGSRLSSRLECFVTALKKRYVTMLRVIFEKRVNSEHFKWFLNESFNNIYIEGKTFEN